LPPHDSGNLTQVIQIMGYPGSKELSQSHRSELGMHTLSLEIGGRQGEGFKAIQIGGAKLGELVEQFMQRPAL
jgi:hypothetical protein